MLPEGSLRRYFSCVFVNKCIYSVCHFSMFCQAGRLIKAQKKAPQNGAFVMYQLTGSLFFQQAITLPFFYNGNGTIAQFWMPHWHKAFFIRV